MEFLAKLNGVLRAASLEDLRAMAKLFGRMWYWLGPEHLKVLLWLHGQGSGTYDVRTISEAVAVKDTKGEPWPGPVQIERILVNLEDAGFIRVWWAERMGIRTNHPFQVECDRLGGFWNDLGEVIQSATYRDLQGLQRVYRDTDLMRQPAFYLGVLAWAGARGTGPVTEAELREAFGGIYREVKFAFDGRNPGHALRWFVEKGLLNARWDAKGELIELDTERLRKWGFTQSEEVQA